MTLKLSLLLLLFPMFSFARVAHWDIAELRRRFEVRGEIYVLGPSGKKVLYKAGTWNTWKTRDKLGKIENQWSSNSTEYGPIAIRHQWQVTEEGNIKVRIELFGTITEKKTDGPIFSNLIKTEERELENLETVTLVTSNTATQRVIVRFTPSFSDEGAAKPIEDFPIAGTDVVITDNQGLVWADHLTHGGKYTGFVTYRGTLFLSYHPFSGSKELGIASGEEIELDLGEKRTVTLRSKTPYLPENVSAKVYGVFMPDRKSSKFPSSGVMDRSEEKEFVEAILRGWPK